MAMIIDKPELVRAAHAYARSFAGRDWSYRQLLRWGLQMAWERAKDSRTAAQRQVDELNSQIAALTYKSARIDITARRRALKAQIAAIAA